ncbi:hypothetical protein ElyMa_001808800 [Elysia marginata]|uniref:Uncharacterized protein n=1 Tax=Elysia marginata TaxID=1093978 RepID=A0AAV4EI25_9GAST|nr:hypothetical protein ElyMa_001808800 [Elysia marginata]
MALSDKVKPHNPKVPIGKVVVSPVPARKTSGGPTSPRIGPSRPVPVNLTPESTCLGGAQHRKPPSRTGSVGSTESQSPTSSTRGLKAQYSSENDSGRSSIASNFSAMSNISPPQHRRLTTPSGPHYCHVNVAGNQPSYNMNRPPLPSYHTVMHNSAMMTPGAPYPSTLPSMRRPPLPGYQEATNMARRQQQQQQQYHHYQPHPHHHYHQQQQQQQQQHRSYSHDNSNMFIGVGHGPVAVTGSDSDYDTPTADGPDEEQVSAV